MGSENSAKLPLRDATMLAVARVDMIWGSDMTDERAMAALQPHTILLEKYYRVADAVLAVTQQPKGSPMDGTIAGVLAAVLKYGESCREVALSSAGQLSARQRQGEAYGEVLNGLTALCLSEAVRECNPNAEAVMDALRKFDPNAYTERGEESWGDDGEERCETWKQQCQRDQDELRSLKAQIAEQAKRCHEAVNVMRASADGATQEHTRKRAEAIRDVYAAQAEALEKMLQP